MVSESLNALLRKTIQLWCADNGHFLVASEESDLSNRLEIITHQHHVSQSDSQLLSDRSANNNCIIETIIGILEPIKEVNWRVSKAITLLKVNFLDANDKDVVSIPENGKSANNNCSAIPIDKCTACSDADDYCEVHKKPENLNMSSEHAQSLNTSDTLIKVVEEAYGNIFRDNAVEAAYSSGFGACLSLVRNHIEDASTRKDEGCAGTTAQATSASTVPTSSTNPETLIEKLTAKTISLFPQEQRSNEEKIRINAYMDALEMAKDHQQREISENIDYQAAMYEIGEIVRVARDNPDALREFLMDNFPQEWGLTKEQHRAFLTRSAPLEEQLDRSSAAFEAWVIKTGKSYANCFEKMPSGDYHDIRTRAAYGVWKARTLQKRESGWLPIDCLLKSTVSYKALLLIKLKDASVVPVEYHADGQYESDFEGIGYTLYNIDDATHYKEIEGQS